jgi:GntR family transcriptional regulator
MAYKQNKWRNVYQTLKDRILDGTYPPGSPFLTNKEIGSEFDLHTVSVQSAVNELIREGLVVPSPNRATRRTVRTKPIRSLRKGGFFQDSSSTGKAEKELLELKIIEDQKELPEEVAKVMQAPVLYYNHNQIVDGTIVANSISYIPNLFNLGELERRLKVENARLYKSLEALGHKPVMVEEELVAVIAEEKDKKLLRLPENSLSVAARIDRKVFDEENNLVEYCFLTDRADCYIFSYRFPLY